MTHGQERIETKEMPMMIADLTLYIMRNAVTIPPHKMPIHNYCTLTYISFTISLRDVDQLLTVVLRNLWLVHSPNLFKYSTGHPPRLNGVPKPPVIAPIPPEYVRPISARNRPMPTPVATLIEFGIILTSH